MIRRVEYRPAQLNDAEIVALLHARSWRMNFRGDFADAFLDGDLPGERLGVWHQRLADPPRNQFVQLALHGTDLLGFVCAYGAHDPQWGSFIDNLHVADSAKGSGIGSCLMRQAGAWLASLHANLGVYLLVLESNSRARRFYERLGAKNEEVSTTRTHGGAVVRSCRYTWERAALLSVT